MTAAIFQAIPAIMADVDAIAKTRKNQQQGYMFRGIDDVYNAIHPLLAKHKVFPTCEIVSREVTERQSQKGGALFYVNLKAKYTLWASDGSSIATEAWGEAMDSADKASNKAMSAAYKYAIFQLLCIPTEAVDSERDSHDVAPAAKQTNAAIAAEQSTYEAAIAMIGRAGSLGHIRAGNAWIERKYAEIDPATNRRALLSETQFHELTLQIANRAVQIVASSHGIGPTREFIDALHDEGRITTDAQMGYWVKLAEIETQLKAKSAA